MTWRFQPDAMPNGLTATPREINAILRAYADEMSGHIDRDNIDNKDVTNAKFVAGAIRTISSYPEPGDTPTTVTLTIPALTGTTGWQTVKELTIDTLDSWLDIDANFTAVATAGTQRSVVQLGIAIDDVIVLEACPAACSYDDGAFVVEELRDTMAVSCAFPVQAGAHRVTLLACLRADTLRLSSRSVATVEIPYFWICAVEHAA